jgi:hypothetical protein
MAQDQHGVVRYRVRGAWELSPRCEHVKPGHWLFEWQGSLWCFDPPTQLQKDIWLTSFGTIGPKTKERRMGALRWLCGICGTIQRP